MKQILHALLLPIVFLFSSVAICQNFEVYVSDGGNYSNEPWQILKFDENGENPEVFIDEELAWPQDIVFLEDQNFVLISNLNSGKITRYEADQGTYVDDFATGINGPTRMKIGADSLLYVLQWSGNGLVKRYELDGTYVDDFTDMGVSQSIGLDWDSEGNLYVSSWGGGFIRKFDTNGNDLGVFINSSLQGPTNIWFDENGELLVLNWSGSTAKRFDSEGVFLEDFITGLMNAEGVAYLPNGHILIGNGGTSSVKLFDADGNYIEEFVESGVADLLLPNAVVVRPISTVSVDEVEHVRDFITPSLGTTFALSPSINYDFKTIEVYNLSGVLLEQKEATNFSWDATMYPEAVYIIVGRSDDGKLFAQKVMRTE